MSGSLQTGDTGHVLVVEDDESTALFVTRVLTRHGFTSAWVIDAEQATVLLEAEAFDVLLADYRLPGRSGLDLARDTRRLVPDMGIAVMTSFSEGDLEQAARSSGADDFFEKPLHSANLVSRITELVRRSRAAGRRSRGAPPAVGSGQATPVGMASGSSPETSPALPHIAESGSGEQAPSRGGALAWRNTDRTSDSGGHWCEGTGGISRARFSALFKFLDQGVSGCEGPDDVAPREGSDLTDRDRRARASHPSAWRSRAERSQPVTMWASAASSVSVASGTCRVTNPQLHTSTSWPLGR